MTTYPDTAGMTNGDYRKARKLDRPYKYNPRAWEKIRKERQEEKEGRKEADDQ